MSQPSSSAEASEPRHIDAAEMRGLLRQLFAQDQEADFLWRLSHRLNDPFQQGKNGRFRLHPLALALGVLCFVALSVMIYFSFVRS